MRASKFIQHEKVTLDFSAQFPEAPPEERTLNLVVNPTALTPAMEAEMQKATDVGQIVGFITSLVLEWDLLDDDGKPLELTYEGIKDVPIMLLGLIVNGIGKHIADNASEEGKL